MKLLKIQGIKKEYDSKPVLKDVTFSFHQGKIYALLGRNGAGKTTLFNCLAQEVKPDAGMAELFQDSMNKMLMPSDIGYVFSTAILPEFLTGYEFIRFFMDVNKDKIKEELTIGDYFDMVKLVEDDRHKLIKGYSHGMKNKLQMMMVIIARPAVILLDEPLTSLDVVVALEMKQLLRKIAKDHIIIFSTHILQLATDLCDEIVILNDGALEQLDHSMLKDPNFEVKLIHILSEDNANG
jgi:ABC-2 type transport system ATP-binding protein